MSLFSKLFFCAFVPHTANKSSPAGSGFTSFLIHPLTGACTPCFCYIMTKPSSLTLHKSSSVTWTHFSQLTSPYHILKCLYSLSSSITGCTFYSASQSSTQLQSCPAILLKCRIDQKSWSLTLLIISWEGKNGTYKWNETGNKDRIFGWFMGHLMVCASTAVGK